MMKAAGRTTWIGGNLGGSLLPSLDAVTPDDAVVLEISSFQSQRLAWEGRSPHAAAVLNLSPNHLDRHKDMAEYADAKRNLIRHQTPDDFAVLNGDDAIIKDWTGADSGAGTKALTGSDRDAPAGVRIEGETVRVWRGEREREHEHAFSVARLRLVGGHNRFNAACAGALAALLGAEREAIERAIAAFEGLPERLELVREKDGVRFVNDSIATTPDAAIAGLTAYDAPVGLIAGGSSKKHAFDGLARAMVGRCRRVVLLGATADEIAAALDALGDDAPPYIKGGDLDAAVREAAAAAEPGDVVLLSPACASYDMFRNYRERGRMFVEIVNGL